MKSIQINLPILRPLRLVFAICVCALLFFSSAFPALAARTDSPKKGGESNLLGIEEKAGEVAREGPLSAERTKTEANQGLNEIQGSSDINQMSRPENTGNPSSPESNVQQKLEKLTGKLQGKG